jgi:hypothetical protein
MERLVNDGQEDITSAVEEAVVAMAATAGRLERGSGYEMEDECLHLIDALCIVHLTMASLFKCRTCRR